MENLAIKVIMQIPGGGIRRVHHLTMWVVCRRFSRLLYARKATPGVCTFRRPLKTYKLKKTSLGDPEFESCYPQL